MKGNRKRIHEKENIESSDGPTNGSTIVENVASLVCKGDSSNSITQKCDQWTLGHSVRTETPMLADMGLSLLQVPEESLTSGSSPSNTAVLQDTTQNIENTVYSHVAPDEEFFVFKRRRLDTARGDGKFYLLLDEIVINIFKWLPKIMLCRCAQVCKRWKRLAFDETLWRRLDLGGKTLHPGVVGRVLLRGVATLRLAKADISFPIFCPQLHHFPSHPEIKSKLLHLDLCMASISPKALEEMLSICKNLRKVSLQHCELTTECCKHLSKNQFLDTLDLSMCYNLTSDGLIAILKKCQKLEALNVAWTDLRGEKSLGAICRSFPPSLLRLNISGCRSTLNDSHITSLSECCPDLLELDVSDAGNLTDASIFTIINRLKYVEYLSFARCYGIAPDSYLNLSVIESLMYLDVYGMFHGCAINTLHQNLPKLKINKYLFSSVARPTVGIRRTSIWGLRVRD